MTQLEQQFIDENGLNPKHTTVAPKYIGWLEEIIESNQWSYEQGCIDERKRILDALPSDDELYLIIEKMKTERAIMYGVSDVKWMRDEIKKLLEDE